MKIVWLTVRRITNEILGVIGLRNFVVNFSVILIICDFTFKLLQNFMLHGFVLQSKQL